MGFIGLLVDVSRLGVWTGFASHLVRVSGFWVLGVLGLGLSWSPQKSRLLPGADGHEP